MGLFWGALLTVGLLLLAFYFSFANKRVQTKEQSLTHPPYLFLHDKHQTYTKRIYLYLHQNKPHMNAFKKRVALSDYPKLAGFLIKWLGIAIGSGILVGSASALLLVSLFWATDTREMNKWIIWLLPIGGLVVGLMYHYWGKSVVKGNNQLIDELHKPKDIIPFKMAPLIYIGTVITHLFGGSAGREGTAVQMGGAIVDQLSKVFNFSKSDRKILIVMGISAGFASVSEHP